jgi:hypothetical protein
VSRHLNEAIDGKQSRFCQVGTHVAAFAIKYLNRLRCSERLTHNQGGLFAGITQRLNCAPRGFAYAICAVVWQFATTAFCPFAIYLLLTISNVTLLSHPVLSYSRIIYDMKTGKPCARCEALPSSIDGDGKLYLWFPLGHTFNKVINHFLRLAGDSCHIISDRQCVISVKDNDDVVQARNEADRVAHIRRSERHECAFHQR